MSSHYQPLVETPEVKLANGMRELNGLYTLALNRFHD